MRIHVEASNEPKKEFVRVTPLMDSIAIINHLKLVIFLKINFINFFFWGGFNSIQKMDKCRTIWLHYNILCCHCNIFQNMKKKEKLLKTSYTWE